jgi:hypothetical protein
MCLTMHVRARYGVHMNTMTAQALAAKLATPTNFTIGELSTIARAFGVTPDALLAVIA